MMWAPRTTDNLETLWFWFVLFLNFMFIWYEDGHYLNFHAQLIAHLSRCTLEISIYQRNPGFMRNGGLHVGVGAWHSYWLWGCMFLPRSWGSPCCEPLETSHHSAFCISKCGWQFRYCVQCPCFALLYLAVWQEAEYALKHATNLPHSNLTARQRLLVAELVLSPLL